MKYYKAKYVLAEAESALTPVTGYHIKDEWFELHPNGRLDLFRGLLWNGPSGPTIDTDDSIRASAYHDVFCWLMRDGRISYELWQDAINEFFELQCRSAGMPAIRAKYWHWGVEIGDAGNPEQGPEEYHKIYVAP